MAADRDVGSSSLFPRHVITPLYDDRILQIVERMCLGLVCDIRQLVIQTESTDSFHGGCRMPPNQLMEFYKLDEELCDGPAPREVTVFDDLLTTGSHFKAMKGTIQERWPDAEVSGIFIARRYIPEAVALDECPPE